MVDGLYGLHGVHGVGRIGRGRLARYRWGRFCWVRGHEEIVVRDEGYVNDRRDGRATGYEV